MTANYTTEETFEELLNHLVAYNGNEPDPNRQGGAVGRTLAHAYYEIKRLNEELRLAEARHFKTLLLNEQLLNES